MVMISFESPALWSLHIIRLLWGWKREEQSTVKEGKEGSLAVKAAEQKEKTIISALQNFINTYHSVQSPS